MTTQLPTTTTTDPNVRARIAVLPVGAFEQHGPHLPLATDTLIATAITHAIADRHNLFRLPAVSFGCSHEHAAFTGTVSISATTLAAVVQDIVASLAEQGIHRLLILNAHGGNYVPANIAQQANPRRPRIGLYPSRDDWNDARRAANLATSSHDDMHAGELETSILLASAPDYLRAGWENDDHTAPDRRHLTALGTAAYSPTGVIGTPSAATADKGRTLLRQLAEHSDNIINILSKTGDH